MKNLFSINFLKVDLRKLNNIKEAKKLLLDNNVSSDKVCSKKLFANKKIADVVFLDKNTFNVIAYIRKGENSITLVDELTELFMNSKPIEFAKEVYVDITNVDLILEKIGAQGLTSLTKKERNILDDHSKG